MKRTRDEYTQFFTHMQEEDKKESLGGMAWDEVCWWVHDATEVDRIFTETELANLFPDLLGHITREER